MAGAERCAAVALLACAIALAPARAQVGGRPARTGAEGAHGGAHGCLGPKERRAAVESGAVLRLAAALRKVKNRMPGTLVRARLCHRHGGLVYLLTVLARDGKVVRITVDAVKGTLVGGL